ncbi:hypothetical protein [Vampirovibrio chlorellavorus]|uniref:hypothetical protein n=1 Tax=Vampirovibrio chlorellavorus TaxID=758823 RepID=UPI0026F2175B|nr:hypothetical protein [Vampirovibrio chlorellavorus]
MRTLLQRIKRCRRTPDFTLAELLISLSILALIATFTIPKILVTQQNNSYNAAAKEVAAMVSAAYDQHKLAGNLTTNTTMRDLTPYMNYLSTTSSPIDYIYGYSVNVDCTSNNVCLRLHAGGVLMYHQDRRFNGTNLNNGIQFYYAPDGLYVNTTNDPGKAIQFTICYKGRVPDVGNALTNTQNNVDTYSALPAGVAPWFSWN